MIFSSATFLVFLAALLVLVALARSETQRKVILFAASLFFYGWWDWRFCFFLVVASVIDYRLALLIHEAPTPALKKRWLILSVTWNLGILAVFKYAGWLLRNLAAVLPLPEGTIPTLDIPLPLGISFFTFQAMSYTIDVYRGQFNPTRRLSDFAFSMSFFPHLIAGPIVRAAHFMPQLAGNHPLQRDHLLEGFSRFAKGFLKKTLLADQLAVCADAVFADPTFYSPATCWLGVLAYTAQIYYDFSGYTDMAIGLARMFGYRFPENFDHPYLSHNITEFWRRWHISLSTWLRDYLYISLGGNRRGRAQTYVNLIITMLLGGLWHGANWTFVAWGALHGTALAVHKAWRERWPEPRPVSRVLGPVFTFLFVVLCWVFFRAQDFSTAHTVLAKLAFLSPGGADWPHVQSLVALGLAIAAHAAVVRGTPVRFDLRLPLHLAALFGLLAIDLLYARAGHNPFIYFQF